MLEPAPATTPIQRRTRRDPIPHFKRDVSAQLDAVVGCPELQVSDDHLARQVREIVESCDTTPVEQRYSSLGRHGFHPKRLLAVWVYASLVGIHHATKLARALLTDAAFRLLSGGHAISRPVLNRFRLENAELFARAIDGTIRLAHERGLIDLQDLAIDSVRIRAHAATTAVRSKKRSKTRLKELDSIDVAALGAEDRASHEERVSRHRETLRLCDKAGRSSIVTTSSSAALMKFPASFGLPGHRLTVAAAGQAERLVVGVLIDSATSDYGHIESVLRDTARAMRQAGVPSSTRMQVAADAGYWSLKDLQFAEREASWVDVLIAPVPDVGRNRPNGFFGRDDFQRQPDGKIICPAGTLMKGPQRHDGGRLKYIGVGCETCSLRPRCTDSKRRNLSLSLDYEATADAMRAKMADPAAKTRYNRRIATVEPVFSTLEDGMAFRRTSSRFERTVRAELLLKVLAYNVGRLIARRSSRAVLIAIEF